MLIAGKICKERSWKREERAGKEKENLPEERIKRITPYLFPHRLEMGREQTNYVTGGGRNPTVELALGGSVRIKNGGGGTIELEDATMSVLSRGPRKWEFKASAYFSRGDHRNL